MGVFGTENDTRDGSCIRDFIHVADLMNSHYAALNCLRQDGLKFTANCGYFKGYSVLEVIDAVKRVSGKDFAVVSGSRRPDDVSELFANAYRLKARLSWEPKFDDLDLIVEHALRWEERLIQKRKSA
jgi:UDP-glucose 4-epimerase